MTENNNKQTRKQTNSSFWDRAKAEDSKRVNAITTEKQRIEVDFKRF